MMILKLSTSCTYHSGVIKIAREGRMKLVMVEEALLDTSGKRGNPHESSSLITIMARGTQSSSS